MTTADSMLAKLPGKWAYDRIASSGLDRLLNMQGIGWSTRKTLQIDPFNLNIETASIEEVVIQQENGQGLTIDERLYPAAHEWQDSEDRVFGYTNSRSCWIKVSELPATDLQITQELPGDDQVILTEIQDDNLHWTARQIWCFEGDKLVKRMLVTSSHGDMTAGKLVYNREEKQ